LFYIPFASRFPENVEIVSLRDFGFLEKVGLLYFFISKFLTEKMYKTIARVFGACFVFFLKETPTLPQKTYPASQGQNTHSPTSRSPYPSFPHSQYNAYSPKVYITTSLFLLLKEKVISSQEVTPENKLTQLAAFQYSETWR
jgi:hypothetical protein